jgi:hypothetical protein
MDTFLKRRLVKKGYAINFTDRGSGPYLYDSGDRCSESACIKCNCDVSSGRSGSAAAAMGVKSMGKFCGSVQDSYTLLQYICEYILVT